MKKKKQVAVQDVGGPYEENQSNRILKIFSIRTEQERRIDRVCQLLENKDFVRAREKLQKFSKAEFEEPLLRWRKIKDDKETDESILHVCTKCKTEENIHCLMQILYLSPDLVLVPRTTKEFAGQTALHLAVAIGKVRACEEMLNVVERSPVKFRIMMNSRATGKAFENTAMMGQIPLFVAALTFKERIVDLMLQRGASLFVRNGKGDTVFHSIIKYTVINRDKMADARRMISFLHRKILEKHEIKKLEKKRQKYKSKEEKDRRKQITTDNGRNNEDENENVGKDYRHIWYLKNSRHLTPLQLAAKYGLVDIFFQILDLKNVYCFEYNNDGLFDEKKYDITEIDSITSYKTQRLSSSGNGKSLISYKSVKTESIFEMMFGKMRTEDIVEIIEIPPIRGLIKLKWHMYRKLYFVWMVIHMVFMVMLSAYTITMSEVMFRSSISEDGGDGGERNLGDNASSGTSYIPTKHQENYIAFFRWFSFTYGLLYFCMSTFAVIIKFLHPHAMQYWKHNLDYILIMLFCGLGLIIDVIWQLVDYNHDHLPLIFAVMTGWWFNLFFLRGLRLFSFFTVMIKRVIFGDFLRFSVIITYQLISFSTSLHMQYQGRNIPSIDSTAEDISYSKSFSISLLTMFNLMLGLGGLDGLKLSRSTSLTNALYITFVLTTYIMLLNALIAMMSSTCTFLLKNKYSQWRIQQLLVILLLENIAHPILNYYDPVTSNEIIEQVNKNIYNPITKTFTKQVRYLLDMKSLQNDMVEMEKAEIEEVVIVNEKQNQSSLNNNINKKILKTMAASAFLLPFVEKNRKMSEQKSSEKPEPVPEPEPEVIDTYSHPLIPAIFHEYQQNDWQSEEESDNESILRRTATAVFNAGRRGTVVEPFIRLPSDDSDQD